MRFMREVGVEAILFDREQQGLVKHKPKSVGTNFSIPIHDCKLNIPEKCDKQLMHM